MLSFMLFALTINSITTVLPGGILHSLYINDLSVFFSASRMAVAEMQL